MKKNDAITWLVCCLLALAFLAVVGCDKSETNSSKLLSEKEADKIFTDWFNKTDTAKKCTILHMNVSNDYIGTFLGGLDIDTFIHPDDLSVTLETECKFESDNEPTHYVYLESELDVSEFTNLVNSQFPNEIIVDDFERFTLYVQMSKVAPFEVERFYQNLNRVIQFKSRYGALQRIVFQDYSG
jgi:hypothetical protein